MRARDAAPRVRPWGGVARYADEVQLWQIATTGGVPTRLSEGPGLNGFGDHNGVVSPAGDLLVYSSISPVVPN